MSSCNAIKTRHAQARERGKADAAEILWEFDGRRWNRYQIMELLVGRVAEGDSLADICKDPLYPTLREVRGWYKNHPDFETEMKESEACRGAILGEKALYAATHATRFNTETREYEEVPLTDKDDVPAAKLKHDAYAKHAARLNADYQDKQVVKQEGELASLTEDQLKSRLEALLESNPSLRAFLSSREASVEAEIISEPPRPTLAQGNGDE